MQRVLPWLAVAAAVAIPVVAAASGDDHELDMAVVWHHIFIHVVNFVIFVGIIVYFVRRPLMDYLANRKLNIATELDESRRLKTEAEDKYTEIQDRLAAFDAELDAMIERVRKECVVERERAIKDAEAAAEAIARTTQRTIAEETEKARHDLRMEAVEAAVVLAERVLRDAVGDEDQRRLASSYLESITEEP